MKYKTDWIKEGDIERKWYIIDVKDQVLGRAATEIASLLIGKNKVNKVPNMDSGDYVVVINSDEIKVTRGKEEKKTYFRHSGYPGGAKTIRFDKQMDKNSVFVIENAVKNMLPKDKLREGRMLRLNVYSDSAHKHSGQNPEEYKLSDGKKA